jgi:hypothetical protein
MSIKIKIDSGYEELTNNGKLLKQTKVMMKTQHELQNSKSASLLLWRMKNYSIL